MDLYLHDAFISYSRKDKPFAVLLERTLRRYTPPSDLPVPKRRLDIFRDEEDFTGTEYYQAVGRHLQGSRKLIVICSPNARASSFVNDEIQRFTQVHAAEDLIPVLCRRESRDDQFGQQRGYGVPGCTLRTPRVAAGQRLSRL